MELQTWLWGEEGSDDRGRIPAGVLSLLVGAAGLNKSVLSLDLAAKVTRGTLPGALYGKPARVLLASSEDSASKMQVARLLAAGADMEMEMVSFLKVAFDDDEDAEAEGDMRLPDDMDALRALVEEGGYALLIVDVVNAHVAFSIDTHKDQHIRQVLDPLGRLADKTGCTVVALTHLNRSPSSDTLSRIMGSTGFGGAARNVLLMARDPRPGDDSTERRVLVHAKCNAGPKLTTLAYEVEPVRVEADGLSAGTVRLRLTGFAESVGEADVLTHRNPQETTSERESAAEVLREVLSPPGKRVPAKDAKARVREVTGVSERTVIRAAKDTLEVVSEQERDKDGKVSGWTWHLPERPDETPEEGSEDPSEPGCQTQDANPEGQPPWPPGSETQNRRSESYEDPKTDPGGQTHEVGILERLRALVEEGETLPEPFADLDSKHPSVREAAERLLDVPEVVEAVVAEVEERRRIEDLRRIARREFERPDPERDAAIAVLERTMDRPPGPEKVAAVEAWFAEHFPEHFPPPAPEGRGRRIAAKTRRDEPEPDPRAARPSRARAEPDRSDPEVRWRGLAGFVEFLEET